MQIIFRNETELTEGRWSDPGEMVRIGEQALALLTNRHRKPANIPEPCKITGKADLRHCRSDLLFNISYLINYINRKCTL